MSLAKIHSLANSKHRPASSRSSLPVVGLAPSPLPCFGDTKNTDLVPNMNDTALEHRGAESASPVNLSQKSRPTIQALNVPAR